MFSYLNTTLDNGLRVLFIPTKSTSVVVNLLVGVGSKDETANVRGISHFLEHMFFKGTKKRPTPLSISRELDKIGAVFNAGTYKEKTNYWIKSTPEHLELMMDMISDMVGNPLLKQSAIDRERGVILEELNMVKDDPARYVEDLGETIVFGNNPLGWDIIGTKKTIKEVSRKDFVDYVGSYYRPSNMVLAIVGGLKKEQWSEVKSLVRKWFGKLSDVVVKKKDIVWSCKDRVLVKQKKTEQSHIFLSVPTFNLFDPRKRTASVLSIILGGNMSSRLFRKIRENRGWAYYVYTSGYYYPEGGYFSVRGGIKNKELLGAIEVIKKELLDFSKTVTSKEVAEAKSCLKGRLLLSLESADHLADLTASGWLMEGKIRKVERILSEIEKVNLGKIRLLAKEIFQENRFQLAAITPNNPGKITL